MKKIFRISRSILLMISILLIYSCKKDKPTLPIISTTTVSEITYTTAISGGNLTSEGGSPILSRGICWNTSENPTVENNKTIETGGIGSFTSNITQLSPNTIYYVRAYATNIAGTGYGNQVSFTTQQAAVPTLTTKSITSISQTYAFSGGNITSDNGGSITVRGVCWSLSEIPTISDYKSEDGNGIGEFTSSITGLTNGTTYYVRAYAINSVGAGYGSTLQFTTESSIVFNPNLTYGSVTDIDGNIYKIITIGDQVWMAENLKTTKYNNGDLIGTTIPATQYIQSENTPKYQWAYNGDECYVDTYGRLYTWYSVTDSRGVCPTSWHVPTDAEWLTLSTYLENETYSGGKLKEISTAHWLSPNTGATNQSGFTALPGGLRSVNNTFNSIGKYGYWWSSSEWTSTSPASAWGLGLGYDSNELNRSGTGKNNGFSVRCIQD